MHAGQGQRRKRNMNDEPVQRRGCVIRQSPRTAQEDSKKEAGSQKHVVVHRTALVAPKPATSVTLGENTMAAKLTIDKTSHLAVRCAILAKMTLGMPADNILLKDLESAIASFRASGSCATRGEALLLPSWRD